MYFVQLKVDFRDFPWFCKVLGAPAGPAGPEPPEASRAAAEQSLSEDLEDFQAQSKDLEDFSSSEQESRRTLIEFVDFSRISNGRRGFGLASQPGDH